MPYSSRNNKKRKNNLVNYFLKSAKLKAVNNIIYKFIRTLIRKGNGLEPILN